MFFRATDGVFELSKTFIPADSTSWTHKSIWPFWPMVAQQVMIFLDWLIGSTPWFSQQASSPFTDIAGQEQIRLIVLPEHMPRVRQTISGSSRAARRANRGELGSLHQLVVMPRTLSRYCVAVRRFLCFAARGGEADPSNFEVLDALCVKFVAR